VSDNAEHDVTIDVTEVLVRYASAIDRRDWDRLRSCFTDDCAADYGPIGSWESAQSITTWMAEVHDACGYSLHRLTNFDVRGTPMGATARCYVDAIVMGPDNKTGTRAIGFYDDDLVRQADGWAIARRTYTHLGAYLVPDGTPVSMDG